MALTNILKALAIVAVIGLHVLAAQSQFLQLNGKPIPGYFIDLNLIFRFSVPLFVALSGFGLAKSLSSKWGTKPKAQLLTDFYLRRVLRLLPWYLFWGAIIYFYANFIGQGPANYGNTPLWKLFVSGRLDYHLYFVPMVVQLYLVFPLLWLLIRKFPKSTLLFAFTWQLYWYNNIPSSGLSDQQQYIRAASWIFYFVLGIFAASKEEVLQRIWLKIGHVIMFFGGLIWALVQARNSQVLGIDPIIFTRFTQIPVLVYATGFILSGLFVFSKVLTKLSPLIFIGELSYIIYLCHTLVLRLLTRLPSPIASWPFFLFFFVEVIASVVVAFAVQKTFSWLFKQGQSLVHRHR